MKTNSRNLTGKVFSGRVLEDNALALKAYDNYKKTSEIIDRAEFASGKRLILRPDVGSTLNFEVNRNGAYSTITQKI